MSNNRNPYMSQNMSANTRSVNMRGNYGCQNPGQVLRPAQNDCGCNGNAASTAANYTQRPAQNDCGCNGNAASTAANYTQRPVQNDCGCAATAAYARISEMPTSDRLSLLKYIDEVSFGAYEATLYLDTHPDCQNGMQYFRELNERRNLALKEYAKLYGPLTLMHAGESCETCWQWINQPWPWEGGNC